MIEWKELRHVDDGGALRYLATVAGVFDVMVRPAIFSIGYEVRINDHRVKGPPSATVEEAKAIAASTLVNMCRKVLREIGESP